MTTYPDEPDSPELKAQLLAAARAAHDYIEAHPDSLTSVADDDEDETTATGRESSGINTTREADPREAADFLRRLARWRAAYDDLHALARQYQRLGQRLAHDPPEEHADAAVLMADTLRLATDVDLAADYLTELTGGRDA